MPPKSTTKTESRKPSTRKTSTRKTSTRKAATREKAVALTPVAEQLPAPPARLIGGAAKLAWIVQQIRDNVEKTGFHDHLKYDFFQEHGILKLIKPYLERVNAGYIVSFEDFQRSGNHSFATAVCTVYDAALGQDDPNWGITARYSCEASDKQDKASYKMLTQGTKYALQKMFGIPTETIEDADSGEAADSTATEVSTKTNTTPKAINARKAAALRTAAQAGVEAGKLKQPEVTAYLTATFGKGRITELTQGEGETFEAWLNGKIGA